MYRTIKPPLGGLIVVDSFDEPWSVRTSEPPIKSPVAGLRPNFVSVATTDFCHSLQPSPMRGLPLLYPMFAKDCPANVVTSPELLVK
jgi:hypothetical protein